MRAQFEDFVRWTIEREPDEIESILPAGDRDAFFDYYAGLPDSSNESALKTYVRGSWNGEAGWMARWIAAEHATGRSVKILDAGCGFGTFAMLFARLGAEVVGVDLRMDRLNVARLRRDLYDVFNDCSLPVSFEARDLTRPSNEPFDAAWVYNAISHIDPIERFVEVLAASILPGGVVVIGDINGANAGQRQRLANLRDQVHVDYVDATGERHAYANERMFTPRELRSVLEASGFQVVVHELVYGGLGLIPPSVAAPLHMVQQRIGHGERWARRQFVVARPAS